MIKVKFLQDEIISFGPQRVVKDQELELPDGDAQALIQQGIAEPVKPPKVHKEKEIEPEASPEIEDVPASVKVVHKSKKGKEK